MLQTVVYNTRVCHVADSAADSGVQYPQWHDAHDSEGFLDVLASELLQSFQKGLTHGKRLHSGNGTVTNGRRLKSGNDSGMGIDATALHLNCYRAFR